MATSAATCWPCGDALAGEADTDVQSLLDSWGPVPAYVRDRRFDVLMANKAAMALAPLYLPGRNLVRDVFLDPAVRGLFPDWPQIAEQTVAALRATADPRDPVTAALVAELRSHTAVACYGSGTTSVGPATKSSGSTTLTSALSHCAVRPCPSEGPTSRSSSFTSRSLAAHRRTLCQGSSDGQPGSTPKGLR